MSPARADDATSGDVLTGIDLRTLRRTRRLRATDVAAALSVHPNTILRWERGERLPGPRLIHDLADALGVPRHQITHFFDAHRPAAEPATGLRGTALRPLRRGLGITAQELAGSVGTQVHTLYNWEAGRCRIPGELLEPLADGLRLPPQRLLRLLAAPVPGAGGPSDSSTPRPLEALRRRRGLTVTASARHVGVSRGSITAWEKDRAVPPLWAIRRLATLYGVGVADVVEVCGAARDVKLHPRTWRPGDFGEVLATLRAWTRVTQRDLAERLGVGTATVRSWEAGRCRPRAASLRDLERLFGLPRSALDAAVR